MKKRIFGMLLMGAMVIASMSMFTSCKDYDDDINKNAADITALRSELAALKSSLSSELSTATASLNTALANKADASKVTDLAAEVSGLKAKIDAIDLSGYATKADAEALAVLIAALDGKVDKLPDATKIAAVEENLKIQKAALDALEAKVKELSSKGYDDTAVKKDIADLKKAIEGFASSSSVADLAKQMNELSDKFNKADLDKVNVLEVLVKKKLTSITLEPAFYWEGLEAIEAPFISQTPVFVPVQKDYKFTYKVNGGTLGTSDVKVTVKEVMAAQSNNNYFGILESSIVGGETFTNAKAYMTKVWPTAGEKSLTIADIDAAVASFTRTGAKKVDVGMAAEAYYHINPAKANIEDAKLTFFENDAEVYTRAGFASTGKIKPTAVESVFNSSSNKANVLSKGVLKVPFNVEWKTVLAMFNAWTATGAVANDPAWDTDNDGSYGKGKQLPFVSLQIEAKTGEENEDTVVTSDYAVVVPAVIKIIALADKAPERLEKDPTKPSFVNNHTAGTKATNPGVIRDNHLYESVGYQNANDWKEDGSTHSLGAIPMPATHGVQFDGKINLLPLIETHISYETYTKYGMSTEDRLMTEAEMKALGLHYEFTPITYITDINVTDQSAHIEQVDENGTPTTDKKSGWFAPRSVDEKGNTISGKTATREVIDREPLIRVDLVDSNNNIVRYGYIKLRIVEKKADLKDTSFTITFDEKYYMNCGAEVRVTWSQMENLILAKLNDGKGLTKQEFEKTYYMENEAGVTRMPDESTAPFGKLYGIAATNNWWAIRYYEKTADKFAIAADVAATVASPNKENTAFTTAANYAKFTATNNWWGRVWYTPHDNSTNAHAWDENTNVIVWNLYDAYNGVNDDVEHGGNMNLYHNEYVALMKAANATYESKGASQNEVSTTIRFINKNNNTSVYVKLVIPAGNLLFQYAGISNKDWSHWWKINTQIGGVTGTATKYWEEFDVHANTPVPAAKAYAALTTKDFKQDMRDYWKSKGANMVVLGGGDKFTKYYNEAAATKDATKPDPAEVTVDFEFVTPTKDLNSESTTADAKGQWKVKGASGTVWTLKLNAAKDQILAVEKNGKAYPTAAAPGELVCELQANAEDGKKSILYFNGLDVLTSDNTTFPAATDLLNASGRYDALGNARYTKKAGSSHGELEPAAYLAKDIDETFTAYIKVNVTSVPCYDPLIAKNYFNVRCLRPINVARLEAERKDIPNVMQRVYLSDLVDIIDYRDIPVVAKTTLNEAGTATVGRDQVFNYGGTKFKAPAWSTTWDGAKVKEQNAGVPYEFYGVSDLAVIYNDIRTDHDVESATVRGGAALTDVAEILKLTKVTELSSLYSTLASGQRVLQLFDEAGGAFTAVADEAKPSKGLGKIEYTNNSGIVQQFHIYVPIAVKYNWGNIKEDAAYTGALKKLDNNYTQTVWAVITVKPSY